MRRALASYMYCIISSRATGKFGNRGPWAAARRGHENIGLPIAGEKEGKTLFVFVGSIYDLFR